MEQFKVTYLVGEEKKIMRGCIEFMASPFYGCACDIDTHHFLAGP